MAGVYGATARDVRPDASWPARVGVSSMVPELRKHEEAEVVEALCPLAQALCLHVFRALVVAGIGYLTEN